jgi:ubiquitin-associated SH3 domain-containing protein
MALARQATVRPLPVMTVTGLTLTEQFHGLELESPWLKEVTAVFAQTAYSPTRTEPIRPKEWLHLSLAYGFPLLQHFLLAQMAREVVDAQTAVSWELRFYERHPNHTWTCHQQWLL